jgi:uncharacterized protein (DUF2141 family)
MHCRIYSNLLNARLYFLCLILFLPVLPVAAEAELTGATGELHITISNIETARGTLLVAVFNKGDYWLDSNAGEPPFLSATKIVSSTDNATVVIENMPAGNYAISIFHDLNGNEKLDTNFIGFPKEPFGFSAPMGRFGPPKYEDASISVRQGVNPIEIALN